MPLPPARPHPFPLLRPTVGALLLLAAAAAMPAGAQAHWGVVNLQNDVFVGRDGGGYTNGLYLSSVRRANGDEGWGPTRALGSLAQALGGGTAAFNAHTLGHAMATPRDISTPTPDPNDAPYAAALMYRAAHVLRTERGADLWALTLGVTGPAAGGKHVQKLVHKITGSEEPRGWDTQQGNRFHAGLEFDRAWLLAGRSAGAGGTPWELTAHAGGIASTLESSAGVKLLVRYGGGVGDPSEAMGLLSRGSDPLSLRRGWQGFAGVSLRRVFHTHDFQRDDPWRIDMREWRRNRATVVAGLAYSWGQASLSFALHSADPALKAGGQRQTYGSLTYAFALR
ncbi:lipid A deacylase LpxR family protein [Xenophilus sp. Marseille-Q4582]|uniref:lipid A deacylase LpxR family protein n=1 Tax=Xenophilus sp. Marseille-Q4582 TaxID=2866600 RepID=UPI001CE3F2BE|nr:lipid A deacylase LpxR family protein [Xenophilus sp. Marseille-Q4582]